MQNRNIVGIIREPLKARSNSWKSRKQHGFLVQPRIAGSGKGTYLEWCKTSKMRRAIVALLAALRESKDAIATMIGARRSPGTRRCSVPDLFTAVAIMNVPPPLCGRGRPLDTMRESGIESVITSLIGAKRMLSNVKPEPIIDGNWPLDPAATVG